MKPLRVVVPLLACVLAGGGAAGAQAAGAAESPSRALRVRRPCRDRVLGVAGRPRPGGFPVPDQARCPVPARGEANGRRGVVRPSERALRPRAGAEPQTRAGVGDAHVRPARAAQVRRALQAARDAYAIDPDDPETCGALGDASLELGDLAAAETQYDKLVERLPSLFAYSRMANLRHAKGDTAGAIGRLPPGPRTRAGAGRPARRPRVVPRADRAALVRPRRLGRGGDCSTIQP